MSRRELEAPIHRTILSHLRRVFPDALIVHAANEIGLSGRDVARQIAKAKSLGMVPGFPDLAVFLPDGAALFFEIKAPGNHPTPAQKDVLAHLQSLGFRVAVVRSVQDVDECLDHWNVLPGRIGPAWQSVGAIAARLKEKTRARLAPDAGHATANEKDSRYD